MEFGSQNHKTEVFYVRKRFKTLMKHHIPKIIPFHEIVRVILVDAHFVEFDMERVWCSLQFFLNDMQKTQKIQFAIYWWKCLSILAKLPLSGQLKHKRKFNRKSPRNRMYILLVYWRFSVKLFSVFQFAWWCKFNQSR